MSYTVKASNSKTKEGKASVTTQSYGKEDFETGYILITANNKSISLEVDERFGAQGEEIWVVPKTLGLNVNESTTNASVKSISENKYRLFRILNTIGGRLALFGLILALIGQVIKLSFVIGDTGSVIWSVLPVTKSILIWIAAVLELLGLLLIFIRAVWFGIK